MQLSRLLLVGLSALSVAEASYIRIGVNVPHHKNLGALARRADDDSSSADVDLDTTVKISTPETTTKAAPVTTTSVDPPADPTTTPKPVSVSAVTTSSAPASVTTTAKSNDDGQPPVTANPNGDTPSSTKGSSPSPSSSASAGGSGGSSNDDDGDSKPSSSVKPVIKTVTQVITTTDAQGVAITVTTEALTTSTPPPSLASDKDSEKSGEGMSKQTRNTVIGVVVGVGGAIILAGLGIVAWRIWGRKRQSDEADNLMEYNDAGKPEVGGSMVGRTPFQSTLESYHAPTHVNQASNF
jgi:hypothetical protein